MSVSKAKAERLQTIEAFPGTNRNGDRTYVKGILQSTTGRSDILLNKRVGNLKTGDRFWLHFLGQMSIVEISQVHPKDFNGEPRLVEISIC